MLTRPPSLKDNGLDVPLAAAAWEDAELAVPLAPLEPLLLAEAVIVPDGMLLGIPEAATAIPEGPSVGRGELGSTVHPPAVKAGHSMLAEVMDAAYADCATPVGFNEAHCVFRESKSG